jgi:hypothetical protein
MKCCAYFWNIHVYFLKKVTSHYHDDKKTQNVYGVTWIVYVNYSREAHELGSFTGLCRKSSMYKAWASLGVMIKSLLCIRHLSHHAVPNNYRILQKWNLPQDNIPNIECFLSIWAYTMNLLIIWCTLDRNSISNGNFYDYSATMSWVFREMRCNPFKCLFNIANDV